ncbi:MAG: MoxR family ATPase [Calditrichaeota bacterium]|nr:MAG: MoxR family ATPase [Calditrichota bacterium]MBL1204304.1 MoxR family ATPase [Calditrichota bacterium]NOG44134.1 MoxR family ATPase [Calditrichota bacterium]
MSDDVKTVQKISKSYKQIVSELSKVIVGQDDIIEKLLISLYAKGHCMLIGVPGLAKTLIIKTLGEILGLDFARIQFTPDLMPSDITGAEILEEDRSTGKKAFRFMKGPIFANIILADEINRTPPKTQSALLEAMQEYNVTTAGETFALEEPFFVLATQNPIEQEGTYPLPEAQLDRFMFSLWLDYPKFEEEVEIVKRTTAVQKTNIESSISKKDILKFQKIIKDIPVADNTVDYAVKLVSATRKGSPYSDEKLAEWIRWGAGPRASQYLILGAKVRAVLHNRFAPEIEDVKAIADSVLRHRIVTSFSAEAEGVSIEDIISHIIAKID